MNDNSVRKQIRDGVASKFRIMQVMTETHDEVQSRIGTLLEVEIARLVRDSIWLSVSGIRNRIRVEIENNGLGDA